MSGSYNPYATYLQPAFPGMKVDSMDDNVDTWPSNGDINFGVVVSKDVTDPTLIVAGGTAAPVGIALHDHIVASRGKYTKSEAVSVLNRGRAWVIAQNSDAANIKDGAAVKYSVTGIVQTTTGTAVPNAVFRGPVTTFVDLGGATTYIAPVELHYPFV